METKQIKVTKEVRFCPECKTKLVLTGAKLKPCCKNCNKYLNPKNIIIKKITKTITKGIRLDHLMKAIL